MKATPTVQEIARMIDHSLLHPAMTDQEIGEGCDLARQYQVATVCVKPYAIAQAREKLAGSDVGICAVIGFPHGNSTTAIKVKEAVAARKAGATEIDMVVNIGKVATGDWAYVGAEIQEINQAVIPNGGLLKVIFENDFLQEQQIVKLCEICSAIQVAFVKTSTGYGFVKQPNGFYAYQGATVAQIRLMRQHCVPSVQIKAAGGVRTLPDLLQMRALGVTRVGASATAAILDEAIAAGKARPCREGRRQKGKGRRKKEKGKRQKGAWNSSRESREIALGK